MKNEPSIQGFSKARVYIFVLIAAILLCISGTKAQVASKEHIYIHTDRNGYLAGETVFFKAYLYLQFAPSDLSSSVSFQLADLSGNIMVAGLLPVTGGTAAGSIGLSADLPEGVYLLNTMTKKLSPPLPSEVYSRPVYVFNPGKKGAVKPVAASTTNAAPTATGASIAVANSPKGKLVTVAFPDSGSVGKTLRILGIMENQVVFKHQFALRSRSQSMQVPTLDLPDGMLHLVLTTGNGTVLSRQVSLIENGSANLPVTFNVDSFSTHKDNRNLFTLGFPAGTSGTFSISVTEAGKDINPQRKDIFTTLLKDSTLDNIEIDNSGEFVQKTMWIPDTNFISVKGRIDMSKTKIKTEKGDLIFLVQNRDSSSFTITPNVSNNGEVNLEKLYFEDTATFSYGWSKSKRKTKIDFELPETGEQSKLWPVALPFFETSVFSDPAATGLFIDRQKELKDQMSGAKLLDTVFVKGKTKSPTEIVNAKYTRGVFTNSNMARVIDFINQPVITGGNILEYLQGKISGLNIVRLNNGYQLTSTRVSSMTNANPAVNVYLDEQLSNQDFVRTIPVNDVALVKYFPPGNSGMLGMGNIGALLVYTKRPEDLGTAEFVKNENTFRYPGYSVVKTFNLAKLSNESGSYYSPTLYWNPSVYIAGEDNKFVISFLNPAGAKKMKVVVEGFTEDGKIVSFEKIVP